MYSAGMQLVRMLLSHIMYPFISLRSVFSTVHPAFCLLRIAIPCTSLLKKANTCV
jgi:hypothetical protein